MKKRDWTYDEIVLTIDAWHRWQREPSPAGKGYIVQVVANTLRTTPSVAYSAIQAVGKKRKTSHALQLLLGEHRNPLGLRDPRVAASEARRILARMRRETTT